MQKMTIREFDNLLSADMPRLINALGISGKRSGNNFMGINPTRADSKPGSFVICQSGGKAGTWSEFATGDGGGPMALIHYIRGGEWSGTFDFARKFLAIGGALDAAETRRLANQAEKNRIMAESKIATENDKKIRTAKAMFINASRIQPNDMVASYLGGRGIKLPITDIYGDKRMPGVRIDNLMHAPTGDKHPCMIAPIFTNYNGSQHITGVHRTYLAVDDYGVVSKLPHIQAKMMYGVVGGGFIPIWRPKKSVSISYDPGCILYIAEGIEDAITIASVKPVVYVWAGLSLGNLGKIKLPDGVAISQIVFCGDNDADEQLRADFIRAVESMATAYPHIQIGWVKPHGAKDYNDWLQKQ